MRLLPLVRFESLPSVPGRDGLVTRLRERLAKDLGDRKVIVHDEHSHLRVLARGHHREAGPSPNHSSGLITLCCAPVNDPFSWPNSSDARSDGWIAPQFTLTSGREARCDRRWMERATSSFPVPVSPTMSTVASVIDTAATRFSTAPKRGLQPTSSGASASLLLLRAGWRRASPCWTAARRASPSNGFVRAAWSSTSVFPGRADSISSRGWPSGSRNASAIARTGRDEWRRPRSPAPHAAAGPEAPGTARRAGAVKYQPLDRRGARWPLVGHASARTRGVVPRRPARRGLRSGRRSTACREWWSSNLTNSPRSCRLRGRNARRGARRSRTPAWTESRTDGSSSASAAQRPRARARGARGGGGDPDRGSVV